MENRLSAMVSTLDILGYFWLCSFVLKFSKAANGLDCYTYKRKHFEKVQCIYQAQALLLPHNFLMFLSSKKSISNIVDLNRLTVCTWCNAVDKFSLANLNM